MGTVAVVIAVATVIASIVSSWEAPLLPIAVASAVRVMHLQHGGLVYVRSHLLQRRGLVHVRLYLPLLTIAPAMATVMASVAPTVAAVMAPKMAAVVAPVVVAVVVAPSLTIASGNPLAALRACAPGIAGATHHRDLAAALAWVHVVECCLALVRLAAAHAAGTGRVLHMIT